MLYCQELINVYIQTLCTINDTV